MLGQQIFHNAIPIRSSVPGNFQYFRTHFHAEDRPAKLRISADFQILIYCNGKNVLTRKESGFDFQRLYDEIILSDVLVEGENCLALLAVCSKDSLLALEIEQDDKIICATGKGWKAFVEKAYLSVVRAATVSMPESREECFDARKCQYGWQNPGFDDKHWPFAVEMDCPWQNLTRYTPQMLEERIVYPQRLCNLEAVRMANGSRLTIEAPPGGNLALYAAYLTAAQDTDCVIRSQHQRYGKPDISIDGAVIQLNTTIHLTQGRHFLLVTKQDWLELLFENAELVFSAKEIAGTSCEAAVVVFPEYSLSFNWNEEGGIHRFWPQLFSFHGAKNHLALPREIQARFQPGESAAGLSLAEVRWQHYYQVHGSFYEEAFAPAAVRIPRFDLYLKAEHPETLLSPRGEMLLYPMPDQMELHFTVDMGEIHCGHVRLAVNAPAGTIFDIQCFEMCDKTGPFYLYYPNGFRYIAREGTQHYISPARRGARFLSVTIRNMTGPVFIQEISFLSTQYPCLPRGSFHCSDERLNQIFEICIRTARLCMLDTYVDCPTWEQGFWAGDCQITSLINLFNFGEWTFDQHCLDLIGSTQTEEYRLRAERLGLTHPFDSPEEPRLSAAQVMHFGYGGIPLWSFLLGPHIWEHYRTGGCKEELKKNYRYLRRNLEVAHWWVNERGLFDMNGSYNLLEWANNDLPPCGEITAHNMAYAENLRLGAEIAKILEFPEEARLWQERRERLLLAINQFCWDEKREAYVDTVRDEFAYPRFDAYCRRAGLRRMSYEEYLSCSRVSVQTHTLAILFQCVPSERIEKVMRFVRLVDDGIYICGAPRNRTVGAPTDREAKGGVVRVGSPFFLNFSLAALCAQNEHELALKIIRRDWGEMLARGARTTFEMFDMSADPRAAEDPWIGLPNWTRSAAHAWSASPAIYLQREILGIRPLEAGYRRFTIAPHLCGLTEVSGTVCTPYGPILVQIHRTPDGKQEIVQRSPKECTYVPINE